jgi:hypothetical protein
MEAKNLMTGDIAEKITTDIQTSWDNDVDLDAKDQEGAKSYETMTAAQ